jgi:DNA repair protein RadC
MVKIQKLDKQDRPREKLKIKGPQALSDFELLQALIGSGNKQADVSIIAKETLILLQKHGANLSYEQLEQVTGLGNAKITELLAAIELSKRYLLENDQPIIDSAEKAAVILEDLRDKKQEHFVVLSLDGANRLITRRTVTIGTLNASLVHPREVLADAITDRAASIIVAHNHPSGTLEPSDADKEVTKRLKDAGKLLGINVIDHIIISKSGHYSFIESNEK